MAVSLPLFPGSQKWTASVERAALWILAIGASFAVPLFSAQAHEVNYQLGTAQAHVVSLYFADGERFALERYELFPQGASHPTQTGRTDAQGQVVFIAPPGSRWRLRAFSEDGHGVDIQFEAQALQSAALPPSSAWDTGRWLRLGAGWLCIGVMALALRKFVLRRRDRAHS